jgi:hypothetical protein
LAVRPEGVNDQWRKIPSGELSIDPVADERLGWMTGWAGGINGSTSAYSSSVRSLGYRNALRS